MKEMKINKRVYILIIILILLQSIATTLITNQVIVASVNGSKFNYNYPRTLGLLINGLGISVVIWVFYIIKLLEKHQDTTRKLNNSNEVIDALRGQKHDFHNHLNVIAGLIQLQKGDNALGYIKKVSGNTTKMFSISNVGNPEVAAILYRKYAIAENKGISVEIDIRSDLDDIAIDSVDLSTILFNLVDNAIYELDNCRETEKLLTVDICEHENEYAFTVVNSYPILPSELHNEIFKQGYTTKGGNGHGHGLSTVKQLVSHNRGKINVESYDGVGTIFTVFLPKKTSKSQI
ncbi:ATP-binding protein [Wukongibacter baidiensis]|uniref:sensor histidine kinase n=1 Tax=Wukongibacter baidiensis TaxID=1723361 RepID=UPI003D7F758F